MLKGVKVEGMEQLQSAFAGRMARANIKSGLTVKVGFGASHAVIVHEDMDALHGAAYNSAYAARIAAGKDHERRPQECAKYLETPARLHAAEMGQIVRDELRAGNDLPEALARAGRFLLNKALELVPTDTGELAASGSVVVG